MNIIIVGAGPRGLAVALQLIGTDNKVKIIDPNPISSWTHPNILQNITMRSPTTFDLVTYLPEYQQFSLNNYLKHWFPFTTSQKEIEECNISLNRTQFKNYLKYILKYITNVNKNQIQLVQKEVINIETNLVTVEGYDFNADKIIVATGIKGEYKIPNWVKKTDLVNKLVSIQQIVVTKPSSNTITVIGSGQGAAEIVNYLAQDNFVYWCTNHEIKVENYPVPSYKDWGAKTALGSYYKSLSKNRKLEYLSAVKDWQPSITPIIYNQLNTIKNNYKIINPKDTTDLQAVFDESDKVILATGEELELDNLPLPKDINKDIDNYKYPLLEKGFRSVNYPSISFTGSLATLYDGPRQNSIISAGITAKEIIENIG